MQERLQKYLARAGLAVTVYDRSHARVGGKSGTKPAVATWLVRLIEKTLM